MKTKILFAGILLASAALLSAATNDLTSLLQQGMLDEEATHDLHAAITDYQSLAAQFDKDREIAATAIYRLGECYRKLGQTNEAAAQYERIVREFPDQKTLVPMSQQNLTGLGVTVSAASSSENPDAILWDKVKNLPPSQLEAILPTLVPDALLSELLQRCSTAQADLVELQVQYAPQHPRVLEKKNLIAEYQKQISERIDGIMAALKLRAETATAAPPAAVAALQKQQNLLQAQIDLAEKQLGEQQQLAKNGIVAASDVAAAQQKLYELQQQLAALQERQAASTLTVLPADEEEQKIREIKALVQNSPDLINSELMTEVTTSDHLRVVQYLLDNNANVSQRINNGDTPLTAAAAQGKKAMVELLLAHGANVNAQGAFDKTALHQAAQRGFQAVAEVLLANHADLNPVENNGETALALAAQDGRDKIIGMLLASGANPNTTDNQGTTPLSLAVERGTLESVKLLLAGKADPNAGKINLPLFCAIQEKDLATAELLLQDGANPNAAGPVNLPISEPGGVVPQFITQRQPIKPLWLAIYMNQLPMVKLLLQSKAEPDDLPDAKRAFLFAALGNPDTLEALLDAGAKVDAIESNPQIAMNSPFGHLPFWTPLASAAYQNLPAAADILLKHGANPNARNPDNMTPLHWAAYRLAGSNVFASLLAAKADPNVRDNHGKTPLDSVKDWLNGVRGQIPSADTLASATALADLLRQHGALDNPPDLDLISVTRPSANFSLAILRKGTDDWNHFTLLEVAAMQCQFLAASPNDSGPSEDASLFWQKAQLPFPDFAHLRIRRPAADLKSWKEQTVDLESGLQSGDCSNDVTVEWGDVVEIPEADHPLTEKWPGFSTTELASLKKCLTRHIDLIVNGQTNPITLAPGIHIPEGVHASFSLYIDSRTSFWLKPVLLHSKVVLASSDLSRVKVSRRDPKTGQTLQWIFDCSNPQSSGTGPQARPLNGGRGRSTASFGGGGGGGNSASFGVPLSSPVRYNGPSASDLWLRDGDVIEVPEKP